MEKETRIIDGNEYILKYLNENQKSILYVYDSQIGFLFSIDGEYDTDTENDFIREFIKCNGINLN